MGEIADILADRDVVASATLFEVRATIGGERGDLKPGVYELRKDMPYGDAIDRLVAGPSREIIQLTIPEGLSRREIAPIAGAPACAATTCGRAPTTSLIDARDFGAAERPREPRGLPVPGHLRAAPRRIGAARWCAASWPRSATTSRRSTSPTRAART